MKQRPISAKIIIALIGLLIATSVFLLGLELLNAHKIAWGIKVVNVNIGGKTTTQAQAVLKSQLEALNENQIELVYEKENLKLRPSLKQLGLSFDLEKTTAGAYQIGRGENILKGLYQQILAFFGRYNITVEVSLDKEKLASYTLSNFSAIEDPARSATLIYNQEKNDFDIVTSKEGMAVDRNKLSSNLTKQVSRLSFDPIKITLSQDLPLVYEEAALETYDQIQSILSKAPYYFGYQDKNWPIDEKTLIEWFSFEPSDSGQLFINFNFEEVEPYLINLAPEINRSFVNAILSFKDGQTIIKEKSQPAIEIDTAKTVDQLSLIVLSSPLEIPIIIKEEPAPIREETLEELGIVDFIGQGVSNYRGSSYSRTTNIKIGLARYNGHLIKPGQEFSFNEILGEITARQGYLPEMVIKEKKLVPEYGGGLCQVSTTMFRAAINSGLEITERYAHAFAVGYYNPQGFDATIYSPSPDLKFINDTPGQILIQSYASGTKAYFEFYGQNDGRQVEVLGPYVYQSSPDGASKTVLTQQVFKDEEMIREDKFWSNYKSPALFPVEKNPLE